MYKNNLLRYCLAVLCWLIICSAQAQTYYSIDQIPNPQTTSKSYVSDPSNILQPFETDSLNILLSGLKKSVGVEAAVVVIPDFTKEEDDFNFSTQLFRKWGIGGAHSHNGLLLLVAIDRKKYRFITGYGLEGSLTDGALSTIGNQYLVPSFQHGKYGEGIISAINTISNYLNQPANQRDLDALLAKDKVAKPIWYQPVAIIVLLILAYILISRHLKKKTPTINYDLYKRTSTRYDMVSIYIIVGGLFACFAGVFVLAFTIGFEWIKAITLSEVPVIVYAFLALAIFLKYLYTMGVIRKLHPDDLNFSQTVVALQKSTWWYILLSPFVLIVMALEIIKRQKMKQRFVSHNDDKGNPMTRIDRDANVNGTPYLSAGQRAEEKDNVYHYDIWVGGNPDNFKIVQNEASNFSSFDTCQKCGFKTLAKATVIPTIRATYTSEGKGKKVQICTFCNHEQLIEMVVLAKLTESSNSSSSSSSSSGSSSSSDSSGSFGGGSTGGGGAGGSW